MAIGRVFVTGAGGFIGARLIDQALAHGWEVIALLTPTGDGKRLGPALGRVHVVRGTLADAPVWGVEVARLSPTACVHLSWTTTPGIYLDTVDNLQWLSWSGRLFSLLAEWGCRRIVGIGSCAEYDADYGYLRESTPVGPRTLYAATKASLRLIGQQIVAQRGSALAWARIFNLFGPGEDRKRLVPACIQTLLAGNTFAASSGEQIRDFLHVDDVASGLLCVLNADFEGDINVCSGQPMPVRSLINLIESCVGKQGNVQLGARVSRGWDPPFMVGDPTRLRSLGWQPRYSLPEGIDQTVRWWRDRDQ